YRRDPSIVSSNLTSPTFFLSPCTALKYPPCSLGGLMIYRDILTMCWSIKEVNRNLSDRKPTSEFSIKYLKNACSDLAGMMRETGKSMPEENLEVVDRSGAKKSFKLQEVAEMLYDPRKIVELNLIDNISRWAGAKLPHPV
ncbi:MAG TPA: hypothetical protein PKY20_02170, partial [Methanothrix sp.]|nr:hypothetical protein [Methanothrix sp.]